MSRKDVTEELSEKVAKKLRRQFALVAQEVWVDPDHRVDFVAFSPGRCGRNAALEHELYDKRLLPFDVQVYCPDGGGALRLTYDLQMQAAKSLREDSTLCLLWAMLMDSYTRWRTTGAVFIETGEDGR